MTHNTSQIKETADSVLVLDEGQRRKKAPVVSKLEMRSVRAELPINAMSGDAFDHLGEMTASLGA